MNREQQYQQQLWEQQFRYFFRRAWPMTLQQVWDWRNVHLKGGQPEAIAALTLVIQLKQWEQGHGPAIRVHQLRKENR